jgi:hypothetical protein
MKVKTNLPENALLFPESHLTSRAAEADELVMALVAAFSWFDLEAISELLPEDVQYYQTNNKWEFLAEIKTIFEELKEKNSYLIFPLQAMQGSCDGCCFNTDVEAKVKDRSVFEFYEVVENNRNTIFGILFEIESTGITNIYRCNNKGEVSSFF